MNKVSFLIGVVLLASIPAAAGAEDLERTDLVSRFGVSVSVGGGVTGFIEDGAREAASIGGSWEARVAAGTRRQLAIEAAYIGTAQPIDALGVDDNAVLLGSGLEADARVNILTGAIQPYLLAGAGWTRYDVTNTETNTSDLAEDDNVFHIPLGIGVGYRYRGLLLDARALYRATADSDLLATGEENGPRLDTWSANLRAGFEF